MPECDKFLEYPRYLVYPIGQKRLGGGRRIVQEVQVGKWRKEEEEGGGRRRRRRRRRKVYSELTQ